MRIRAYIIYVRILYNNIKKLSIMRQISFLRQYPCQHGKTIRDIGRKRLETQINDVLGNITKTWIYNTCVRMRIIYTDIIYKRLT